MKKNLLTALALTALTASPAFAALTGPGGGVLGSVHDMNALGDLGIARDEQGRVCAFCHTPHHAITSNAASDYLPLWSHTVNNQQAFTQYDSKTFDANNLGTLTDPLIGPSRLCMSCHDGVIAVDQHYGSSSATGKVFSGNAFTGADGLPQIGIGVGNSLKGTHPIGFNLTEAVTADTTGTGSNAGGGPGFFTNLATDKTYNGTSKKIASQLFEGKYMTCATCHDVHNRDNVPNTSFGDASKYPATDKNYLVFATQAGSQLCLSCHDK